MNTWEHQVEGRGIHALAPNQTCTCKAHHVKEDEMSEHTPARRSIREVVGELGGSIIVTFKGEPTWPLHDAERVFVERACNSYADLMAALEEIANPREPQGCACYWDSGVRLELCDEHDPATIAQTAIDKAHDVVNTQ